MSNDTLTILVAGGIFIGLPFITIAWGFWYSWRYPAPETADDLGDASHYDRSLMNAKRANWRAEQ